MEEDMDYRGPFARIDQLLNGRLAATVQTPVIRQDFTVVSRVVGGDPWWEPRLACARRLIAERASCNGASMEETRKAAHARYLARHKSRGLEQARVAKAGGSGQKKQM